MIEMKRYPGIDAEGNGVFVTIASGPVIIQEGKVLLDKHGDDPFWKFPGGRVRDDESFQQTAKREVSEELGLEVVLLGEPVILTFKRQHDAGEEL